MSGHDRGVPPEATAYALRPGPHTNTHKHARDAPACDTPERIRAAVAEGHSVQSQVPAYLESDLAVL